MRPGGPLPSPPPRLLARLAVQGVRGIWCNVASFQLSTVTDTFTPVSVGQGSAPELTSWRSACCFQHSALSL